MKKVWEKPTLVILVRGKPEEAVLDVCKFLHVGDAPINVFPGCASTIPTGCTGCSAQVES
jgi:hypothetical protein